MFFETKNTITMKGDIGAARSSDQGATWQFVGIALTENWHLSYPFVFNYQNQVIHPTTLFSQVLSLLLACISAGAYSVPSVKPCLE